MAGGRVFPFDTCANTRQAAPTTSNMTKLALGFVMASSWNYEWPTRGHSLFARRPADRSTGIQHAEVCLRSRNAVVERKFPAIAERSASRLTAPDPKQLRRSWRTAFPQALRATVSNRRARAPLRSAGAALVWTAAFVAACWQDQGGSINLDPASDCREHSMQGAIPYDQFSHERMTARCCCSRNLRNNFAACSFCIKDGLANAADKPA